MDYSTLEDDVLVRLVVSRQPEALSALYDRYSRLVFSLAYHSTGDQATAEEITQDVFFRVWEKAGTYRAEQAKFTTWITTITRYRAIDFIRRQGVRPERDSLAWDELTPAATPASTEDPESAVEQSLRARRVRAAVASLPPEQRQALALAYFKGMSHSEIAEACGEPLGTVKTRIRLAMQKLREVLYGEQG